MSDSQRSVSPNSFPFRLLRDRDAWASIRGFVYQVDRTIVEWLDLPDTHLLELERGEDIDRITLALGDAFSEQERRLEQVKHRVPPLTLRSIPAREALANFFQHRHDNPALVLRFRFTTTASVGLERRTQLPERKPAIAAWEQIRRGDINGASRQNLLRDLRGLVLALGPPSSIPSDQWNRFHNFVQEVDDDGWHAFVLAFEWATQAPDSESLRGEIRSRLARDYGLEREADGDQAYQRLFAFVFDRLSRKGIKRLARADLIAVLSGSPIQIDPALIVELADLHHVLAERVGTLEQQSREVSRVLAATTAQVAELAQRAGITSLIDTRAIAAVPTKAPPRATHASLRAATIAALTAVGPPRVISLHGGIMSGKTQLALLIAEQLGSHPAWIRLAVGAPAEAASRLVHAVDTVLAQTGDARREDYDWVERCAATAAAVDVMVLDDVPSFREGDELGSRLLPLVAAFLAGGRSVLLTSLIPLVTLERLLPPESLSVVLMPPFTNAEVEEILVSYSAPSNVRTPAFLRLLSGVTDGHPLLVHAAAQWLKRRDWPTDLGAFSQLIQRNFAEPLSREIAQSLLDGVSDPPTRDLLYRLILAGTDFGREELTVVAEVSPQVGTHDERFTALLGPWVQATDTDRYVISPLARILGEGNLAPLVRRACHQALGRLIVARRTIGELEFARALSHFTGAGDLDTAAVLLIQGLFAVHTRPPAGPTLITAVWSDMPIPTAVSRPNRAMIRALQAAIAHRDGRDPTPALVDLDAVLGELPPLDSWAEFAPAVFVSIAFALSDVVKAAPFVRRAIRLWPVLREHLRAADRTGSEPVQPEAQSLVMICLGGVHDQRGLDAWLEIVRALPDDLRVQFFSSPLGMEASTVLAGRLLLPEYEASVDARDWDRVVRQLEGLSESALAMGATPLVVAARSACISALIEGARDPSPGIVFAEAALEECGADQDAEFLLMKAVGYGAFDTGYADTALEWFTRADLVSGVGHAIERLRVKLRLSQLVGPTNPSAAVAFVEGAVALIPNARKTFLLPGVEEKFGRSDQGDTLLPGTLGELALAHWFAGDHSTAYRTWLRALDALIAGRADDDEYWKSLFVTMGHVSGYLLAVATCGAPPSQTGDGEYYAPPVRGMLIFPKREAAARFRPNLVPTLGIHAMQFADVVGDEASAITWASFAADGLRAHGLWRAAVVPDRRLMESAIVDGDFQDAIGYAAEMVMAYWADRDQPAEGSSLFMRSDAPGAVLDQRADTDWALVDAMIVMRAVLPAYIGVILEQERDASRADAMARNLYAACAAAAAADPDSVVWPEVVTICEATLLHTPDARIMRARGEELRRRGDAFQPMAVLALFSASLDSNAPLTLRLKLQLAVASYVLDTLGENSLLRARIGDVFFSLYWRRVFNESRAHFRAPRMIEQQLEEADRALRSHRPQRVLRTIAWGLDVVPSQDVRNWFAGIPAG